ncbi:MAG TPA: class I SAM-dependent methyltransferase [Gallionellaceae bacterium]|nr:class I SAM-dependent methyltransferase [Gallionellaceae bacterium]
MIVTPEMETLKTRLKAIWMSGDYGHFAQYLDAGAMAFLRNLDIKPGDAVLDVACGAGQISIPAARAGARVTGIDIATNLVEQGRARARREGLDINFDEGDAEQLPYGDATFDVVVSLIGAMFAPRPERVAAELARVCRPGGRIVMGNWTADGFVGKMFKIQGKHVPPPPMMPSPVLWGNEDIVRDRFNGGIAKLQLTRKLYPLEYPFPPTDVVSFFRTYYGPTNRAFASLDETAQARLHQDLEGLWSEHNLARNGATAVQAEYLEVVATRA